MEDDDTEMDTGTAEHPASLSSSARAAGNTKFSQNSAVASVASGWEDSGNFNLFIFFPFYRIRSEPRAREKKSKRILKKTKNRKGSEN